MDKLPVISRFQVFKNRKEILRDPLPFHHRNFKRYGDFFTVKVSFGKSFLFTRHPGLIKHILQKQHRKYQKSPLQTVDLAKYIGHGILTSNGEHWRTHRRMVQPAFHKQKLIGLLGIMHGAIRNELKRIIPNKTQDVFPLMGDLAFQVVAKSLFSRNDIRQSMQELQHITQINQSMLIREMRQPYLKWFFKVRGDIKKHIGLAKKGRNLLNAIIEERLSSDKEKDDLLDMLLKARYEDGTPMSREQLLDEVVILFTAGHETTANALSFTLFLLAKHPEAQEKAFLEVSNLDLDQDDTMQLLSKLPYIKQCLEEGLRCYPPAYIIDRVNIDADEFEGIKIPRNTLILMSIYELHRHSSFWESPETYSPERFDPENGKDFQDYYYPFGAGPRMCVGNNFAMYEMVLTVAEILKKYQLHTNSAAVEINPMISLKPKEVLLNFTER
tara:strand:+ start:161 stop:1486 length:1326 start_codon:yes stop_codon:yes gene_type:complete